MIIKLPIPFIAYTRQQEAKIAKPLTRNDRIKADRIVMAILFMITIIGAIVLA